MCVFQMRALRTIKCMLDMALCVKPRSFVGFDGEVSSVKCEFCDFNVVVVETLASVSYTLQYKKKLK